MNLSHKPFKDKLIKYVLLHDIVWVSEKLYGIFCNKNFCHGKGIINEFIV